MDTCILQNNLHLIGKPTIASEYAFYSNIKEIHEELEEEDIIHRYTKC